jgi:uridylate kinase
MTPTRYQRVLLKLSGEALCQPGQPGVASEAMSSVARELLPVVQAGTQVGIVVGAGNWVRGRMLKDDPHVQRTTADYMGMLATVMNALALRDTLAGKGMEAVVVSAIAMPLICETYFRPKVMEYLAEGKVVIFAGGTSHPGVTTDMSAAIRAADIDADAVLKGTKVDGVFDSDPMENPDAKRYEQLTYSQAIAEQLGVMDLPAMAFCMDHDLPIVVFNFAGEGNLARAVEGQAVGTLVTHDET